MARRFITIALTALALGACAEPEVRTVYVPTPAPAYQAPAQDASLRRVQMRSNGKTFSVSVAIDGICCFPFLIDSGASDVLVSVDLFRAMLKGEHITRSDMIDVVDYSTAGPGKVQGLRFRMPPMTISNVTVHNVTGTVTEHTQNNGMLLGMSFLGKFKSWSIDNQTHELVLKP
jgi:clan AA aspartic protease (TIGR02281 family)